MPGPVRLLAFAVAGVLALVSGCAANRPRLPPRIIDDPVTVPRGMVWLSGHTQLNSAAHATLGWSHNHAEGLELRVGLNRRVEMVNVLGLRLAVLDDSPARTDPDPLALAVMAGLGNGELGDDFFDKTSGAIPVVRVEAGRRIGTRLRLAAFVGQRTYVLDAYSSRKPTISSGAVEGLYQLTEVLAARATLHAYRWHASPRIWRPAVQGGFGPGLQLQGRPRPWLTVGASASVVLAWAARERPSPNPDWRVDDARFIYAEPGARIVILGAQAILHN